MKLTWYIPVLYAATITALTSPLSSPRRASSECSEVTFEITTSAQNAIFSPSPDPQNETSLWEFFANSFRGDVAQIIGTTTVNGTFLISGTYCIPKHTHKPVDTLQILIHGITYSKSFWSGFGLDDRYNWHKQANARGYATLAIDRLGNGKSSRPDPIFAVQPPLELALINQIVLASQGLPSSISPRSNPFLTNHHHNSKPKLKYPKTILIGHSYGSYLAPALTTFYPSTKISALVLTAFSTNFSLSFFTTQQWSSASSAFPTRFGTLPKGYFTQTNATQREQSFYAGSYDKRVPKVDFQNIDTLAAGSFGALATMLSPSKNFNGSVLAVTGELDKAVCQTPREVCVNIMEASGSFFPALKSGGEFVVVPSAADNYYLGDGILRGPDESTSVVVASGEGNLKRRLGKGAAGDRVVFEDGKQRPDGANNVKENQGGQYQYYIPGDTGHDLTLHFRAEEIIGTVHDWLDLRI